MKRMISAAVSIALAASMLTAFPVSAEEGYTKLVNIGLVTTYANDENIATGTCGENLTWNLDSNGILTISGTGPMEGNATSYTYWTYSKYVNDIKKVVFEEGVTSVGDCAFGKPYSNSAAFPNLTEIMLPSTLEKIGFMAFSNLNITSIDFPEGLEIVGESSFSMSKLTSVKLHEGMTLGGSAFQYCNSLKEVTIPKNIIFDYTKMGGMGLPRPNGGFNYCTGIEKIVVEYGATELPGSIFDFCSSLSEVVIYSRDLSEVVNAGEGHETFETRDTNITYKLYKNSTTEKTLKSAGYLTDENTVYLTDFTKLKEEIKKAEEIESEKYTKESYKNLTTVLEAGKAVLENAEATQEEVDNVVKAINDAVNALKEKPAPTEPNPSINPTTSSKTTAKSTRSLQVVKKDKKAAQKAMKQAKIKKLTVKSKAKKKITVAWKKVKKAKGYELQVSTNKKFKKNKIIFKKDLRKTKLNLKNKKFKSNKTFYIRVRAYATYKDTNNKSVKVYSKWNKKLRKVKVK